MEKTNKITLNKSEYFKKYDAAVNDFLTRSDVKSRTCMALSLIAARGKNCTTKKYFQKDEATLDRADYVVFLQGVNSDLIYRGLSNYAPTEKVYLEIFAAKLNSYIVDGVFDGKYD